MLGKRAEAGGTQAAVTQTFAAHGRIFLYFPSLLFLIPLPTDGWVGFPPFREVSGLSQTPELSDALSTFILLYFKNAAVQKLRALIFQNF